MGMKRELRKRLSKAEGRLRREGRRLASVLLCGALVVGNLSAVPVSVLADSDDDNEYTYEIEKTVLQEALQTAVSEGNTVSEELEFAGEHAEEYAELLEADGTLYELELPDDEEEKDDEEKERDKALDLRIFARIEGDIPVDEAYEIDGSEEIVFLLSNKTEAAVTATICVDDLETEVITILPADSIPVEEESVEANAAAVSRGASAGGGGGAGGSAGSTAATEAIETTEEDLEIEITDTVDEEENFTSITEDSEVSIVDEDDSSIAADEDTVAAEEENDSSDPEEAEDLTENAEDGNTDSKDDDTKDTDSNVSDADVEDADSKDSDAAADGTGDTENENADAETDANESEDSNSEDADAEADDTSDAGDAESGNEDASDESGNDDSTDEAGTSDDSSSSDISEDSDVSVLGSAISIHNSVLLAASKATDSDADETASDSDAEKQLMQGTLYEAVRFEDEGAVAYAVTTAELDLEQEEDAEEVSYTYESDEVSVTVVAPAGALPDNAEISVTVYDEDSDEYSAAAEAIDYTPEETTEEPESGIAAISEDDAEEATASSGLAVLDISFMVDGEEVEPTEAVTVTIDASGILPEDVDASTIEVQHLTESEEGLEATLVADPEDQSDGIVDTESMVAEFEVKSFSTFTIQWGYTTPYTRTVDLTATAYLSGTTTEIDGASGIIYVESSKWLDLTSDNSDLAIAGYELESATITYGDKTVEATSISIAMSLNNSGDLYTCTYVDKNGTSQTLYNNVRSQSASISLYYSADTGSIVLNLGNGNGILQDSDYSGGSHGSGGTDLRYKVNVADAADGSNNVTINLPSDSDLDTTFTVATGTSGAITQELGNEAAPYDWKLIGWINIATGEYYDVTGGSVTATVDLNNNNVFYADWVAESYDFGSSSNLGVDTSSFIKIDMFDYNELFNMYSTSLSQTGLSSEVWSDSGNLYAGVLGSGDILDESFIFHNSRTNNSSDENSSSNGLLGYVKNLNNWNSNNEQPYTVWDMSSASGSPVLNKLFDMSNDTIGVKYIGSGNYLFQVDGDGYYYFDSDENGAAYNQSNERFYLSSNATEVNESGWNGGGTAFFPYNEVGSYTSISDGTLNYWFGMSVDMDFYLPNDVGTSGGNQYNNKDMVFEFSGDDDVWVFVDDELVLNISGVHSEMDGSINFTTGNVNVKTNESVTWASYNNTTTLENCSAGTHNLKVYYMERGAWDSNLKIKFNVVPRWQYETASAGTMSVTKDWSDGAENHTDDSVTMGLFEKTSTPASAGSIVSYRGVDYTLDSNGYSYDSDSFVNAYASGGYLYIRVDTQELNAGNNWTYTWELLDESETYEILELTILSNYKTTSTYSVLQDYNYWSAVGYEELNGTVTKSGSTYTRTGGLLDNSLQIVLTDGAQNGEASTSGFPITYTGYVIDSSEGISTKVTQFSHKAEENSSGKYIYGVTSDTYIQSTSVWTVELTGNYDDFTENGSPYYAPTFYLKDSSGNYLTITGSEGSYSLTTVSDSRDATAFSYNSLGELNTVDSTGVKITITTTGNYAVVTGRKSETSTENVKIYVNQDVTTTGKSYTITNTLLPMITLKKVDSTDATITLSGAEFTLVNGDSEYYSYSNNAVNWLTNENKLTTENGTILFTFLPDGTYTLCEVTAPDGYNLLGGSITMVVENGVISSATYNGTESDVISVDSTKLVITVKNTAGSALPETGGPGTMPFRLVGLLLTSCSAFLIYQTLRRRRNCFES